MGLLLFSHVWMISFVKYQCDRLNFLSAYSICHARIIIDAGTVIVTGSTYNWFLCLCKCWHLNRKFTGIKQIKFVAILTEINVCWKSVCLPVDMDIFERKLRVHCVCVQRGIKSVTFAKIGKRSYFLPVDTLFPWHPKGKMNSFILTALKFAMLKCEVVSYFNLVNMKYESGFWGK